MKVRSSGGLVVVPFVVALAVVGVFFAIQASATIAETGVTNDEATEKSKGEGSIGGTVRFAGGKPVSGLVVDYFIANPDGSRNKFIGDVKTDPSGVFSRVVEPGCYVLTYIAPDGGSFVGGGRYFQLGVCVDAGEKVTDLDAYLAAPKGDTSIGGTVRFADGMPVNGLVVDYFVANPDGSRNKFVGDENSDPKGRYRRVVEPGCYVLVFIAPAGESFTQGGRFLEAHACVDNQTTATINAELATITQRCEIRGEVVATPLGGQECDGLIALFESTEGPNWVTSSGWNTATDPCTWIGVSCSDSKLTGLNLNRNNLRGSLPAELGNLPDLEGLSLEFNNIGGPIPPELGRLTRLRTLDLGPSSLSGPIPAELAELGDLEVLDLGGNALDGPIPPELGRLTNLRILALNGNIRLSGSIPAELGQLTNLTALTLGATSLSGSIPAEFGQLTNLTTLHLGQSELSGPIPPQLGRLNKLTGLWLDGNRFSGTVPAELGQLSSVVTMRLDDNLLTGDITVPMSALRAGGILRFLALSDGQGGNNCFTVTDNDLATWLSTVDPNWAECH